MRGVMENRIEGVSMMSEVARSRRHWKTGVGKRGVGVGRMWAVRSGQGPHRGP